MKVDSLDIRLKLNSVWPGAVNTMIADRYYWLPKKESVEDLVMKSFIEDYGYLKDVFDCDDFALILHAFVVQERYKWMKSNKEPEGGEWLPWAFGEVWGWFSTTSSLHAVNFCLTRDEDIVLIEPQNDRIWVVDPNTDLPKFIKL